MTYHANSRWTGSENEPSEDRLRKLLAELDADDAEHPDTSLTHESEWALTASQDGSLVLENLESDAVPRHMENVPREKILTLWLSLARGDLAAIELEPWKPGYGPPITDEEQAALVKEANEITLEGFRRFYDSLEPERLGVPCRQSNCERGAIPFSVFCRAHHFESLYKIPCPF